MEQKFIDFLIDNNLYAKFSSRIANRGVIEYLQSTPRYVWFDSLEMLLLDCNYSKKFIQELKEEWEREEASKADTVVKWSVGAIAGGIVLLLLSLSSCNREKSNIFKTINARNYDFSKVRGKTVFSMDFAGSSDNPRDHTIIINFTDSTRLKIESTSWGTNVYKK